MANSFKEIQQFNHWIIWMLISPIAILFIFALYTQLYLGEPFGNKPASDMGLVMASLLILGIILLFLRMKLETKIDKDNIQIRFTPFVKKKIKWQDIQSAEVLQYGFVGGWGIRLGTKYGTVYNIGGDKGLALELKSGKKMLVGTQREEDLKKVIAELHN